VLKSANLAIKFILELAAFAAFGYWGSTVRSGAVAVIVAIAAPASAIALWALFAAPRSQRRLRVSLRVPFELTVFVLATAALSAAVSQILAVVFAAAVVLNSSLLSVWQQWEQ
jgi:hypothetical protein